jgi:aminopeptidase N
VTVPTGWSAVAHGQLLGVEHSAAGDRFRWHSADPVATYAATLALGHYTRLDDTGPHGLPITYWLRTGQDERLTEAFKRTPKSLAWLEDHFGPYPFAAAGVVAVDSLSAMETQQMVTYGAKLRRGGADYNADTVEEILLHELSHQWFGDAVTPTDWTGLWLNEGWAMYAEWLWAVDQDGGGDDRWVQRALTGDERSRPVAGPPGHPRADHFGENNVYLGPALMLHEIHHTVGDAAFFSLARDWVQTHRNQQVNRDTFIAFVNQHTARDFTALITKWLDSPTTPTLDR